MQKKIKIYDMDVEYAVNYRSVHYPRLEFKTGNLMLILPKNYESEKKIIETHKEWIYKKHKEILHSLKASKNKKLNINRTQEEFKELVHSIIEKNLYDLNLKVNKVYFKEMKSKWASCSSSKNFMVNSLLRYLPVHLIDYVVYHEIAHLKERKHNERFWKIIKEKYKDHQKREKELFLYWFLVQERLDKQSLL